MERFGRGYSNLTYLLRWDDQEVVLRHPPPGVNIPSAHDMGREYQILEALYPHWPKVPEPVLFVESPDVIGVPFYLMERVQGVILRGAGAQDWRPDPHTMGHCADALVDTLVELHRLDPRALELGDLGRPEGYIQRQVSGWSRRYLRAKTETIETLEKAMAWLAAKMPREGKPSLIHNDFKYDNLVLHPENLGKVLALLDWEMATIGDPLMDLGTTLAYWVTENDPPVLRLLGPSSMPGNPDREGLVARYAEESGRDLGAILFYFVYGLFKVAVICQQIYARYRAGKAPDERFAGLIQVVRALGRMADRAIERKRMDRLF